MRVLWCACCGVVACMWWCCGVCVWCCGVCVVVLWFCCGVLVVVCECSVFCMWVFARLYVSIYVGSRVSEYMHMCKCVDAPMV